MSNMPPSAENTYLVERFIIFVSTLIILYLSNQFPHVVPWLAGSLLVFGVVAFGAGMLLSQRYKQVFDYEPTTLFGRPTIGKQVRGRLGFVGTLGGWAALLGLIMWIFFRPHA